ncbi:MAG: polysaccharide export protein [Acidobacteria bacterium]|nr:polysaccharide export protein [Acidobacteriota bacterium]
MSRLRFLPPRLLNVCWMALLAFCLVTATAAQAQTTDTSADAAKQPPSNVSVSKEDPYFTDIYRRFYDTYRLGTADEISIRIKGQPDYSYEKVKVSPVGTIYHMLLGEVRVAGLTITETHKMLTTELSEYLKNPEVSVQLVEAQSTKIAVLGNVLRPGVYVMGRPMRLLDIISEAGGFNDLGNRSAVEVNRQLPDGRRQVVKVNVKNILADKAAPTENIPLQGGDLVIVHGNFRKKMGDVSAMLGFTNFLLFISGRR